VPLFSVVFVFQKSYTGHILGIGRNKSQTSRNSPKLPENRRGDRVGPRGAHTIGRRGPGLGRAPYVCGRLGPLLTMPLRLWGPPDVKNLKPNLFSRIHRDPPLPSTQDREGPKALPGTLPERGTATGGLLHRHACLRRDEWVVYLGLWVLSSS
jgi:hypothetical protein